MYRRPKFLELLLEIREEMAKDADHDIEQFVQNLNCEPHSKAAKVRVAEERLNGTEMKKAVTGRRKH